MLDPSVVALIRDIGLPAVLLVWFLIRLEPRMDTMTEALKVLIAAVQDHMAHQAQDKNRQGRA